MGELRKIPGVGERIERTMEALGIHAIADLVGRDPEDLYARECLWKGYTEDRCALYVWRCAVYFAGHPEAEPERKKWWNWKDGSPFLQEQEKKEENET